MFVTHFLSGVRQTKELKVGAAEAETGIWPLNPNPNPNLSRNRNRRLGINERRATVAHSAAK